MSWHFNADYETWVFGGEKEYDFPSNRTNREFEHFIQFFEDEPVYTTRKYSKIFTSRFENIFKKEFKTTDSKKKTRPWWCPINQKSLDLILHSKGTSNQLAIELGAAHGRLVNESNFSPKEGHIYKNLGELSGRGHFLWPKDEGKIKTALSNGHSLLEEPLRERVFDFSSLILESGEIVYYRNLVDSRFQYKGTALGELDWSLGPLKNYKKDVQKIAQYYLSLGARGPFSVDSYLYEEGGELKLCLLSEVNARKTMGFIALKLAELFGNSTGSFVLANAKAFPKYMGQFPHLVDLSPEDNRLRALFIPQEQI